MAENSNNSFILYTSYADTLEKLPIEQVGEVFLAIMHYAKDGTIPTLEPLPNLCFSFIKSQIDRDKDKYENIKRKRAESGKKGGQKRAENLAANQVEQANQASATFAKQIKQNLANPSKSSKTKHNVYDNDNVDDNVNVNDNVISNVIKKNIPPLSPKGGDRANLFETFYSAYPKHQAKKQALKAFEKLNPDEELFAAIMAALENQKQSDQWQRDNGQYIPLPSSWLNGRRWEDEPTTDGKADKPHKREYTPEELKRIEELMNQ